MANSPNTPDTVATPEGDNEFPSDQPLHPLPTEAEENPRGSAPDDYRQPKDKVSEASNPPL